MKATIFALVSLTVLCMSTGCADEAKAQDPVTVDAGPSQETLVIQADWDNVEHSLDTETPLGIPTNVNERMDELEIAHSMLLGRKYIESVTARQIAAERYSFVYEHNEELGAVEYTAARKGYYDAKKASLAARVAWMDAREAADLSKWSEPTCADNFVIDW